jgi:heterogeneous nuclear rnp K-like protein 2
MGWEVVKSDAEAETDVSSSQVPAVEGAKDTQGDTVVPAPGWRSPHEYEPSSTRPVGADQKPLGRPGKLWIGWQGSP